MYRRGRGERGAKGDSVMPTKDAAARTKRAEAASRLPGEGEPAWEIAYLFPRQGDWTEDDYLGLDAINSGFPLVELSNGRVEVLPMPTQPHQLIMLFVYELLKAFTAVHA